MDNIQLGRIIRPQADNETVVKLVKKLYGLKVKEIKEFNAYDDKNSWINCEGEYENPFINSVAEEGYVLKIMNALHSQNTDIVEGQNEMMLHLRKNSITCPVPVKNVKGSYYSLEQLKDDEPEKYVVRLLIFCPGEVLSNAPVTKELFHDVGNFTARINNTLHTFFHPSYEKRLFLWMLVATPKLREYVYFLKDEEDIKLVHEVIDRFEKDVLGNIERFEKGIIHGDLNEQNLIVDHDEKKKVIAVIDFGDTQYSCRIFELIITLCYMIIQACDIKMGKYVIEGYESVKKLSDTEKSILKIGICARICQSLVLGAYSHLHDSQNDYILHTQKNGWRVLRELWSMTDDDVSEIWGL